MLRSSNAPQQTALAPSSLTTTAQVAGGGIPKGVWIGGGLMALTIVALATALVVKGGNSSTETAPVAANPAVTAPATPDTTTTAQATTQAPAPVAEPAPAPAPVHQTAHKPTHSTTTSNTTSPNTSSGNTTVASNGNTTPTTSTPPAPAPAPAPVCTTCGVIDSYDTVQVQGQTNGVGAVAGGVGGAVLGSQIAGHHNKTLGGVIGAVGGGLLGNAIEKHERTSTAYDVHVRMDDGSMRTVRQTTIPQVGTRVTIDNNTLHAASAKSGSTNTSTSTSGTSGNGASNFSPSGS
jgi:outer membrane lipoprotein SlyB